MDKTGSSYFQNFIDALRQLLVLRQRFGVQIESQRRLVVVVEKLMKNVRCQVFQLNELSLRDDVVARESAAMRWHARCKHDSIVGRESVRRTVDFVLSKAENLFDPR